MKKYQQLTLLSTFALASLGLAGCVMSRTTAYNDVERVKMTFASERAGRLFYEALNNQPKEKREESKHSVSLILINVDRTTVTGPNQAFNRAVEQCDTDKDGIITDEEAQIFASAAKVIEPKSKERSRDR